MFSSIRSRVIVIVLLVVGSIYFLFPGPSPCGSAARDGRHARRPSVTRVPLKRGLDLQGGMHLALELDQSKQVSADPKRDLDLALTVLRKRIDEFGVDEPLVQKAGDDRIVVELAGHHRARAGQGASCSGAPSWSSASPTRPTPWRRRCPRWTAPCAGSGSRATPRTGKPSAVEQLLGGDSAKKAPATARRRDGAGHAARGAGQGPRAATGGQPTPTRPIPRRSSAAC